MLAGPLLLPPILLATLLLVSGGAKLRHPEETRSAFAELQLPPVLTRSPAPRVLPVAEIVLAAALLLAPAPFALVVAVITLGLLLAYLVVIVRALRFDHPVTCSCFGRLGLGEVTPRTAVRNVLLLVVGLLTVWSTSGRDSVATRLLEAPATTWVWLGLVVLTLAVVIATFGGAKGEPVASWEPEESVDYERQPLPFGTLEDEEGRSHSLTEVISQGAVLLVFVSPGCAPCAAVIEQLPGWDETLGPVRVRAVVSSPLATAVTTRPELAGRVLHDPQARLMRTFALANPGAVLLGGDGMLAGGPVRGREAVLGFVEDVRAELEEAGVIAGR